MAEPIGTEESIKAFEEFVRDIPESIELLNKAIEIALQKDEWPHSFVELTEKVIPKILNNEIEVESSFQKPNELGLGHASRAFIGYMKNRSYLLKLPEHVEGKNKYLLEVMHTLYSEQFIKLEAFSNNVRAPYKINRYAPYQTNLDLLTITRVDNVSIEFMLELDQYIDLIKGLLDCYEESVNANRYNYHDQDIERRLKGINKILGEIPEMLGRG
ncbi:TPA: hypothetical protein QC096_006185 [Bacillus thuringiensis]|nr:hypothetical protein [Bacillus thuringiensis]HDR8174812.1 hypothetical protein [Bacillus thuringiensis]